MHETNVSSDSCTPDSVSQPGIVTKINDTIIEVQILSRTACSSCHAQGFCSALESKNKIIEVKKEKYPRAKTGDKVRVGITKTMGGKAVVLAYLIPFIILFSSVLILASVINEGLAGLIAIAITGTYYLIIYVFRDKLRNTFDFSITQEID